MAAKKKASKKKISTKKSAKRKSSLKPKKAAKKKSSNKAKAAPKKKTTSKAKSGSKRIAPVKKAARKKKAVKRASPMDSVVLRGPSIAPAIEVKDITVTAVFKDGIGNVTLTHVRGQETLDTKEIPETGDATFEDARPFDGISIEGVCTGSAEITTDRVTRPATPRKFSEGPFVDRLIVKS